MKSATTLVAGVILGFVVASAFWSTQIRAERAGHTRTIQKMREQVEEINKAKDMIVRQNDIMERQQKIIEGYFLKEHPHTVPTGKSR